VSALVASGPNLLAVIASGNGVFRSNDNGNSWTAVDGLPVPVSALVVNGSNLFAGTASGVYRSTDNGSYWTKTANKGLPTDALGNVYLIQCLASGGKTLFATSTHLLHYDSTYSAYDSTIGRPSGWTTLYVYRSTDNGENWLPAFSHNETRYWYDGWITSLVALDTTVFAVYSNYYGNVVMSVYRSTNSGETWTGIPNPPYSQLVTSLVVSGRQLFAGAVESDELPYGGVYRSTDNGGSWVSVNIYTGGDYHVRSVPLAASGMILLTNLGEGGNFISADSGVNWTSYPFGVNVLAGSGTDLFAGKSDGVWRIPLSEIVPIMSLSQPNDSVSSTAGTVFMQVKNLGVGTLTWTTSNNDSWLLASSDTRDTIAVTYGANPSTSPRTGTVTVNSNAWNSPLTITVTQGGGVPSMSLSQNSDSVSSIARTEFYRVTNLGAGTLTWTTTDNVSWLKSNSDRKDTIAVAIQENTSSLSRIGTVTVNTNTWNSPLTITIFQAGATSGIQEGDLPKNFALQQNYPNPFNPSTTISYALPHRSHVTLTVFNTLGQKEAELVNGDIDAGYHEIQFNASNLASGVYFYRMQAGSYVETKKLLLVR